jgi:hypothetical protein
VTITLILAVVVGLSAYYHFVPIPDPEAREDGRTSTVVQRLQSSDGVWTVTNYSVVEMGLTSLELGIVVASRSDAHAAVRVVYYGDPAGISWQSPSKLVVTEHRSGRAHHLDVATGRYDLRFSNLWNAAVTVGTVLIPFAVVALAGAGLTLLLALRLK